MSAAITTAKELNALPVGSVVLDRDGNAWLNLDQGLRKGDKGLWRHGVCSWYPAHVIKDAGPLTLLYRPDAPNPVDGLRPDSDVIERAKSLVRDYLPGADGAADTRTIVDALVAAGLLTPSDTFASTNPSDADVAERIEAILREHQPTSGMQVASGVTCRCGYWTGEERPGVTRPVGYSGLVWHQAQMIATSPVIGAGTVNGLDVRDWQQIAASKDEAVEAAVGALNRVRELHQPVDIEPSDTICGECSLQLPNGRYFGKVEEWPCATIQALDATPPVAERIDSDSDWTAEQWEEWSNELASLLPPHVDGDEAQEAIIIEWVQRVALPHTLLHEGDVDVIVAARVRLLQKWQEEFTEYAEEIITAPPVASTGEGASDE